MTVSREQSNAPLYITENKSEAMVLLTNRIACHVLTLWSFIIIPFHFIISSPLMFTGVCYWGDYFLWCKLHKIRKHGNLDKLLFLFSAWKDSFEVIFCCLLYQYYQYFKCSFWSKERRQRRRWKSSIVFTNHCFSLSFVATRQIQTSHQLVSLNDW